MSVQVDLGGEGGVGREISERRAVVVTHGFSFAQSRMPAAGRRCPSRSWRAISPRLGRLARWRITVRRRFRKETPRTV
jgi:hypothetical protein